MLRDEWTVHIKVADLLEKVQSEAQYHRNREKHWNGERLNAENELREHGVELRSHEVSGGRNVTAVLDTERTKHLADCEDKVRSHQYTAQVFEGWVVFLKKMGEERTLELDSADVAFFYPQRNYSEEA